VLKLGNSLALQYSTLDYASYGGFVNFGALTSAVLGGLKGGQYLLLANDSAMPVTLSVGNNGQSTNYSGRLDGAGGPDEGRQRYVGA